MQTTFVMLKPDAVRRRLVGEIIRRLEAAGLDLKAIDTLTPSKQLVAEHYAEHEGKTFFDNLVTFMSSGPTVPMIWEGPASIDLARATAGDTYSPQPGTIRGDYKSMGRPLHENLIHTADSGRSVDREIALWFGDATRRAGWVTVADIVPPTGALLYAPVSSVESGDYLLHEGDTFARIIKSEPAGNSWTLTMEWGIGRGSTSTRYQGHSTVVRIVRLHGRRLQQETDGVR